MVRDRRIVAILAAGTAILGAPSLVLPPGRDQAIFSVVGRAIADGGLPYRDAFDFKPPGIHLLYALSHAIGGGRMPVTHALDAIVTILAVVGLFVFLRPLGRAVAVAAGAVYAAGMHLTLRYWDLAQPENALAMLVVWMLVFFRRSRDHVGWAVASGAVLGAAIWMKYNAALFVLLLPFVARPPGSRWAAFAVGAFAPLAGVVAWLVLGDAWTPFREIQTDYLPGYSRLVLAGGWGPAVSSSARIVGDFLLSRPIWAVPAVAGLLVVSWRRPHGGWVAVLGVVLAVGGVIAQGKFFHYHWIPALPFVAWLAGLVVGAASARWARAGVLAGLVLLAGASVRPVGSEKVLALKTLGGQLAADELARAPEFGRFGVGDHAFGATREAGKVLRDISSPTDRVLVWGFEPWLFIVADRLPASRFIYNVAFLSPWCPPSWTAEMAALIRDDPPEVVVVVAHDALPWVTGVPIDSRAGIRAIPGFGEILRRRYEPAGEVEHFTFFRRAR